MTNTNTEQAKIITPRELERLRYPLPESWKKAAGILKHKRKDLENHLKKIRTEWSKR